MQLLKKILLIVTLNASFYSYGQFSHDEYMASELSYEIYSQTGNNGNLFINNHYIFNCSIELYSWGDGFWMYNYPTVFPHWFLPETSHKISCNAHCNNSQGSGTRYNGIYKKANEYASQTQWSGSPPPVGVSFLGSPPNVNGWVIVGQIRSRRDTTLKNIVLDTTRILLNMAVVPTRIYTFPNGMIPFTDSSPRFNRDPVILCSAGDTVNFSQGLYDPDGDSLVVSWTPHLGGLNKTMANGSINIWPIGGLPSSFLLAGLYPRYYDTVTYASGYSYNNPLPDASFNPANIPATLNQSTGDIYFCCHNPGNYSMAIKVSSYRNGQILNDVHREIFVSVFPPDSNHDPKILAAGAPFVDTIYAGDSITIPFTITDLDSSDWLNFSATGFPLDSNLNGTGGCSKPPCAYFSILPPDSFQSAGFGMFHWKTTCNHTAQYQNSVTYNFALSVKDDNCPLPGFGSKNISITVIKPPVLPAAALHCASVDSSGNVLLSWSPAVDTTGFSFKKYVVHFSDSLYGNYTALDTIWDINQSSYFHLGAGANTDTLFYVLETVSSCNPLHSAFSDTIATIFLNLSNSGTGIASLSWNDIRDSLSLGSYYHIYRSIDHQPFVLLDSSALISFVDTIAVCSLEVSYYVSLGDSTGCVSRSNMRTSLFEDKIAPFQAAIDTVSIDGLNHPHISWFTSSSPDVVAYVVFAGGMAVDTLWADSSFFDTSLVVGSSAICYAVAPMDSCGNMGALSAVHCSIGLSAKINSCAQSVRIAWHPNQDTLRVGYQLFYRENGGAEVLLATLGAGDSSFVHTGANAGSSYCYFARALLSSGRSSSSNRFCVVADFSPASDYTYLRVATVVGGSLVRLKVQSDSSVAVRKFIIQRRLQGMSAFSTLASVPYQALGLWYFDDVSANVQQRSYAYRIISVDSCYRNDTSNIGQTILLSSSANANNINKLSWNPYADWQAGVDFYLIHRLVENVEILPPIIVPESGAASYSYSDDVTQFANRGSEFCYFIEAVEAPGNTITLSFDTSFSNLSCINREPVIYIPSAFHPGGGINELFKPVIPFIYGNDYSMIIFNRWGQKLFETHDINTAWDGTFKGKDVPAESYVYLIKLRDNDGNEIVKTGSFVLIR